VTASSDTFYPGQERYDTFSGRVVSRFKGSMEEWQSMGVMNYEMESATLLTMCSPGAACRDGGGCYRQPYPAGNSKR
jgi:uridine phosphorylase